MARTYRRRRGRDRRRQLLDHNWYSVRGKWCESPRLDPHSPEARLLLARYHSDSYSVYGSSAPRWFRKIYDRRIRMFNQQQLGRWLRYGDFDPVLRDKHHHNARYDWW